MARSLSLSTRHDHDDHMLDDGHGGHDDDHGNHDQMVLLIMIFEMMMIIIKMTNTPTIKY